MTRALYFILGAAFGVALLDTQLERHSVMPDRQPQPRYVVKCPPANAAGLALSHSMVHASYIKGEPQPHECYYR